MVKIIAGVVGGLILVFILFGIKAANDPQAQERSRERQAIELCMKDLKDPLIDPAARAMIVREACLKLRNDYVRKWGREP